MHEFINLPMNEIIGTLLNCNLNFSQLHLKEAL